MNANEYLTEVEKRASAATEGPWQWSEETDGWGDCGPNLETVERGPVYFDGSQCAKEEVIGSWGHDANGIFVDDADAEFIAASRTDVPKMAKALRAVLAMVDEGEVRAKMNLTRMVDGALFPPILVAEDVRRAITEALEGEE